MFGNWTVKSYKDLILLAEDNNKNLNSSNLEILKKKDRKFHSFIYDATGKLIFIQILESVFCIEDF